MIRQSINVNTATCRDSDDTLDLRYWNFAPQSPRRYLIFLNGRTEWIEKYSYLAKDLDLPSDCGFLTWDHRGQGGSGGARSYVDHYETFARDAQTIVKKVVGDLPYVMLTHSMGGLIGLYSVLSGAALSPERMALSSPLLGMPDTPVPRIIAKPLAKLLTMAKLGPVSSGAGNFTRSAFPRNKLTHDIEFYSRMGKSPYPVPGASFAWVHATFSAIDFVFTTENLSNLRTPTLILGGSNEHVVDANAFRTWVRIASDHTSCEIKLKIISGAKHELFSEIPAYYSPAVKAVCSFLFPE